MVTVALMKMEVIPILRKQKKLAQSVGVEADFNALMIIESKDAVKSTIEQSLIQRKRERAN